MWKSVSKEDSTKYSFIHQFIPLAFTEYQYSDSSGSILASRSGLDDSRSSLFCVGDVHMYTTLT